MEGTADLARAAGWLSSARHVVAFTGAGISQESGIGTFRDAGGLWEEFPPQVFATMQGIMAKAVRDPRRVARFLRAVLGPIALASPNAGHRALVHLQNVVVVTQNVDRLHQEAGSVVVHEVHVSLFEVLEGARRRVLTKSDLRRILAGLDDVETSRLPHARLVQAMRPMLGVSRRPRVVLFGESLIEPDWMEARHAVEEADVLLAIGTSGAVMPAAALPAITSAAGAKVIGVGPVVGDADLWLQGMAGDVLPALMKLVDR